MAFKEQYVTGSNPDRPISEIISLQKFSSRWGNSKTCGDPKCQF
jgi:hypothetical protein